MEPIKKISYGYGDAEEATVSRAPVATPCQVGEGARCPRRASCSDSKKRTRTHNGRRRRPDYDEIENRLITTSPFRTGE